MPGATLALGTWQGREPGESFSLSGPHLQEEEPPEVVGSGWAQSGGCKGLLCLRSDAADSDPWV
jgi:hypothetical protein